MQESRSTIDKRVGALAAPAANGQRDRSIAEVVKNIVENIQDIVRGEVRLAATETKDAAVNQIPSARLLVGGVCVSVLAAAYLLLALVYALEMVIPNWAAAAVIGVILAIAAGLTVSAGLGRWKRNA